MDTQSTYLNAKQVGERFGVSAHTIRRWRRDGCFPEPVQLGPQVVRWRLSDLENWESERAGN